MKFSGGAAAQRPNPLAGADQTRWPPPCSGPDIVTKSRMNFPTQKREKAFLSDWVLNTIPTL